MANVKEKVKSTAKKAADKAAAETIEAKKTVRKAAKGTKAAAERKEVKAAVASLADDKRVAAEIEVKKGAAKAKRAVKAKVGKTVAPIAEKIDEVKLGSEIAKGRKKAEVAEKAKAVKTAAKAPAKKAAAARLKINIQSPLGGVITPEEISAKVPKDATEVYVRVDENRIYWVSKTGTGSVDIW